MSRNASLAILVLCDFDWNGIFLYLRKEQIKTLILTLTIVQTKKESPANLKMSSITLIMMKTSPTGIDCS